MNEKINFISRMFKCDWTQATIHVSVKYNNPNILVPLHGTQNISGIQLNEIFYLNNEGEITVMAIGGFKPPASTLTSDQRNNLQSPQMK